MTFEKRAEKNSLMRNNSGSLFSKTLLTFCVLLALIGGALSVFATDADGDNFDDTNNNATHPKDCDDNTAGVRPALNMSITLIGAAATANPFSSATGNMTVIKFCAYSYENATIIVNASSFNSSNTALTIDCQANGTARANFTFNQSIDTPWLLINNTHADITVENCTVIGISYTNTTAEANNATLAINLSNASNVKISRVNVNDMKGGAIVVSGQNVENITIVNSNFNNITGNTSNENNVPTSGRDIIAIKNGIKINISGNNFTTLAFPNLSANVGLNISTNNVIVYGNFFNTTSVVALLRSNGSNHYIVNNTFGNSSLALGLIGSSNNTILQNNFTNAGLTITNRTTGGVYITGGYNNTIQQNIIGPRRSAIDGTGIGGLASWCVHLFQGGSNVIIDNEINNCTGNILMNQTGNSSITNNNVTHGTGWLLLANNSFNLSLKNNTWANSTSVALLFVNGSNASVRGDHVNNFSLTGFEFNSSKDVFLHNVSVDSGNSSAHDYVLDRVVNSTLNGFNSSRAGQHGLTIVNSSIINISNFRIINATHNGLLIINSTNITSDYDNVTISEINGTSHVLINVSTNSSLVNLSTLRLAGMGRAGAGGDSPIIGGYGIYVNQSSFISFHNITVKNTSNTSVIYSNVSGLSVIGYCSVSNSSVSVNNLLFQNTSASTFNCTPIDNANMSGVFLKVSAGTGSSVAFNIGINITGNLQSYVNISPDNVYVNQTMVGGGNAVPANVTMSGFGYEADGVLVDYEDDGSFHSCGTNCTATATGLSLAFNVSHFTSYQASRRVSTGTTSGGGGTGGGRGGGYKTIVPTATGITTQLTNYDMGRIQYGSGAYQFVMKRAGKEEVDLRIAQQDYKLGVGKALGVDLDKDGATDVTISLVAVTHNLATFVVRLGAPASVAAPAPVPVATAVPSSAPSAPPEPTGAAVEEVAPAAPAEEAGIVAEAPYAAPKKKLGASTVMAVIVAVIVVLLLVMHFRKKKQF